MFFRNRDGECYVNFTYHPSVLQNSRLYLGNLNLTITAQIHVFWPLRIEYTSYPWEHAPLDTKTALTLRYRNKSIHNPLPLNPPKRPKTLNILTHVAIDIAWRLKTPQIYINMPWALLKTCGVWQVWGRGFISNLRLHSTQHYKPYWGFINNIEINKLSKPMCPKPRIIACAALTKTD